MVRRNLIPVCSDKVATHGVEFSHLSRNVFQIRHAFFVIFAMESSKSDTDTEQTFRRPSEPGPSFRAPETVRSRGGKRRGSGRKRKHEEGYENVRSSFFVLNLVEFYIVNQPRTQALHCFYRDQWQLINAKRARVLGQHAKKPSAQGC